MHIIDNIKVVIDYFNLKAEYANCDALYERYNDVIVALEIELEELKAFDEEFRIMGKFEAD